MSPSPAWHERTLGSKLTLDSYTCLGLSLINLGLWHAFAIANKASQTRAIILLEIGVRV